MTKAVIVVFVALTLLGAARQALGWWQRERVLRDLGPDAITRMDRGVSARALVTGVKRWRGLDSRRRTGLRADLLLTAERFVLATNQGVFVDLAKEGERRLTSARCTGPGRLVLEGETGRDEGMFRFEITVADAQGWAVDLKPYVNADGARFASFAG
ncbi:MAG: hypothetical protein EP330_29255 [Deltaproteobacteria bacterium]|nr:MAG: hypothetical protein EP330_29255 [Deltaproteobacteria bacterium]